MFEDYSNDIYRFIYMFVRDEALAEDLTSDTFTKAWRNYETFDARYPKAWLYQIARNLVTDHWRKHKTVPLDEDMVIVDTQDPHDVELDRKLDNEKLMKAVSKLPDESKQIVVLRFINGYSARQTAEVLDISEANVRVKQHRALKKLKELLT
jgi:RNA polymerase sigma-70 factor (ECF subfamily)